MSNNDSHTDFEKEFFSKTTIQYSKSKEDVWLELEDNLDESKKGKVVKVNFKKMVTYAAAAVLVLGIGILSFLRFYSVNVYCPNGQHSSIVLPDGSKVILNASSSLSYHPYWWKYSRELNFEGEAFFEVKKGKTFSVVSEKGTTTVLGTSFNIFARKEKYKVNCISGKVRVETPETKPVTLEKSESVEVKKGSRLEKRKEENNKENAILWVKNEFVFTSVPLREVYEEVERQYDVIIEGKTNLNELVTVDFKRRSNVEEVLNIISLPSGIKFKKASIKKYVLVKHN